MLNLQGFRVKGALVNTANSVQQTMQFLKWFIHVDPVPRLVI